jgi:hypothetical protein
LITASFDIVNPDGGPRAFNELFRAMREGGEACLHLRSRDDGSSLTVMLSKVTLEQDASGVFILGGETDMGHVTGRLFAVPASEVAGRLTVTTT